MLSRSTLLVMLVAATVACDRVPLGAPSGSVITVSTSAQVLAAGESAEISAFVTESSGTPVQNGTTVRFTTTLGTVDPVEALTRNGVAVTTLRAGSSSGVAQVRATSGGGTGGTGTTATNLVEISIGAAAVATLSLSSSATTVPPGGGTVTLTATVVDASGNRIPGVLVTFSTTGGTLSTAAPTTNANGEASVQLTTSRAATVTARAGSGDAARTGTITIEAAVANSVGVTVVPATVTLGLPVTLTVTPTIGANNSAPRVAINWGDGTSEDIGFLAATRTVSHTYATIGTFTIVATATSDGESATSSVGVVVSPRAAISVSVAASSGAPAVGASVTFTATATEGGSASSIASYDWVIDSSTNAENDAFQTTDNFIVRSFATPGTKTVRVTATTIDGRTGVGQRQVTVGP